MNLINLEKYLFFDRLYTKEDIEGIVNTIALNNSYNKFNGYEFINDLTFSMSYSFKTKYIKIDFIHLNEMLHDSYRKDCGLPFNVFYNLNALLFILHEFNHIRQYDLVGSDNILSPLYEKSIEFVCRDCVDERKILYNTIYLQYHDYFVTEINADFEAYLSLIELLKKNNLDYYKYYEELLMNHLEYQSKFKDYIKFHDLIVGDLDIIENLKERLELRDRILNGITLLNEVDTDKVVRTLNIK